MFNNYDFVIYKGFKLLLNEFNTSSNNKYFLMILDTESLAIEKTGIDLYTRKYPDKENIRDSIHDIDFLSIIEDIKHSIYINNIIASIIEYPFCNLVPLLIIDNNNVYIKINIIYSSDKEQYLEFTKLNKSDEENNNIMTEYRNYNDILGVNIRNEYNIIFKNMDNNPNNSTIIANIEIKINLESVSTFDNNFINKLKTENAQLLFNMIMNTKIYSLLKINTNKNINFYYDYSLLKEKLIIKVYMYIYEYNSAIFNYTFIPELGIYNFNNNNSFLDEDVYMYELIIENIIRKNNQPKGIFIPRNININKFDINNELIRYNPIKVEFDWLYFDITNNYEFMDNCKFIPIKSIYVNKYYTILKPKIFAKTNIEYIIKCDSKYINILNTDINNIINKISKNKSIDILNKLFVLEYGIYLNDFIKNDFKALSDDIHSDREYINIIKLKDKFYNNNVKIKNSIDLLTPKKIKLNKLSIEPNKYPTLFNINNK